MTHGDVEQELDRLEQTFVAPRAATDAGSAAEHAAPPPNHAHERRKNAAPPATKRVHRQS